MQTLFAWILTAFIILAAYAWADWLVSRSPARLNNSWLSPLVTLGFSLGALTLIMFWEMLLGLPLTLWGAVIPYFAVMLPGWWLHRPARPQFTVPSSNNLRLLLILLLIICAGIVFNGLYWPFNREDTLGIYAFFGRYMAENQTLAELPGQFTVYEAYPILIPLTYTYAYLASGWQNDSLAAMFPALLSIGCLAAVYMLGTFMRSNLAGWLAAALLAFTPAFSSWASSGYVDLPMACFYTLAAIFSWRLWHSRDWSDALLTGLFMGLAAWTKNAALVGLPLFGAWLIWTWLKQRIGLRHLALAVAVCVLIAAPWYIRNWLGATLILPPTAWTEQAQQTLETLFVFVTRSQNFYLSGFVIVVSIITAASELTRRRLNDPALLLLLLWTLPFYGIWWLFASYDPRFILLFLPLLCVLAGIQVVNLWERLPAAWQRRLRIPTAAVGVILALIILWNTVEFKDDLLRNPLMSVEERRATVLSERQPEFYKRLYGDQP